MNVTANGVTLAAIDVLVPAFLRRLRNTNQRASEVLDAGLRACDDGYLSKSERHELDLTLQVLICEAEDLQRALRTT